MNSIEINTSQNVNVDFLLASVGDRMLAFILDMLIKFSYLFILWLFLVKWSNFSRYLGALDNYSAFSIVFLLTLPINIYTLLFESLTEGQTPGKKLAKIRVMKGDAYQATFADYFARWLFRIVDVFFSSGLIGILFIILHPKNQRLGDLVAGTVVISLKNKYNIDHTILMEITEDYQPRFPQVIALSDNDVRIIKEHFTLAKAKKKEEIIAKLVQKIEETTGIQWNAKEMNQKNFIDCVLKDYNFYTKD